MALPQTEHLILHEHPMWEGTNAVVAATTSVLVLPLVACKHNSANAITM